MENTEKKLISLENLQQYNTMLQDKMADDNSNTLTSANDYTDQAVAQKSSVQFCIWEEND